MDEWHLNYISRVNVCVSLAARARVFEEESVSLFSLVQRCELLLFLTAERAHFDTRYSLLSHARARTSKRQRSEHRSEREREREEERKERR